MTLSPPTPATTHTHSRVASGEGLSFFAFQPQLKSLFPVQTSLTSFGCSHLQHLAPTLIYSCLLFASPREPQFLKSRDQVSGLAAPSACFPASPLGEGQELLPGAGWLGPESLYRSQEPASAGCEEPPTERRRPGVHRCLHAVPPTSSHFFF